MKLARLFDRIRLHEQLFTLLVAIFIGTVCGFAAIALRGMIAGLSKLFWGDWSPAVGAVAVHSPGWRVLVPTLGGLLMAPIVYKWVRAALGNGAPEVMAAVALNKARIQARVAAAKAMASSLTLASGGSAGREGPIILIGSALGSTIGQWLGVSARKMRTFVACGASAGIAATFNAPIAGALFSVESILGEVGVAHFSPIVVSSVVATVLARYHLGNTPVFDVPDYELISLLEVFPYLLLGLLCALVALAFMKLLFAVEDLFVDRWNIPWMLRPALGGLLLGIVGLWVPHVFGDGYATINMALHGQAIWYLLLGLLVAKMAATSLTIGSGGSGGVFAPCLFLGAMTGGVVGEFAAWSMELPGLQPGAYALVGMGGVVAAATRAPITAIVVIFEITSDYNIILPLMTVCIVSTVVHLTLSKESIYTLKLARRGINLFRGRTLDLLRGFQVHELLRTEVTTVDADEPMSTLLNSMLKSDEVQYYVTTNDNVLSGVINLGDVRRVLIHREGLESVLLAVDVANEGTPECFPDENLSKAMVKFERSGLTSLPVVERDSGRLLGELRYLDVVQHYNNQVILEDTAGSLADRVETLKLGQKVKLVEGYCLTEWEPPASLCGRRLGRLRLPTRYGVHVLMVKKQNTKAEEGAAALADAQYVISQDETLVIYGKDADVEKVLKL